MFTNLHSAFDHEALESSNACFDEGYKVLLRDIEQSLTEHDIVFYLVSGDNPAPEADVSPALASGGVAFNREVLCCRCWRD